jgi:hypothetical protein
VLVPAWRNEKESLLVALAKDEKEEAAPSIPPQAKDAHIRNIEEFVCLNYLAFVQNVLGRLRTMAITIIALFVASACAMSSYPFDPRQALSAVLIVLFAVGGVVIVKVYADMHRDATLSHVTKTTPGELGTEFWFKLVGFGYAVFDQADRAVTLGKELDMVDDALARVGVSKPISFGWPGDNFGPEALEQLLSTESNWHVGACSLKFLMVRCRLGLCLTS